MDIFTRNKKKNIHQLTDITRGLHHAASTTSAMLAQQYLYMFEQYFNKKEDGQYEAKTVSVNLPDNKRITIPLISLVNPKGLALDNMKVALSVRFDDAALKKATHEMDGIDLDRSSFSVELSPKSENRDKRNSNIVDIELEFKSFEPPEGIMRAIDQFASFVSPHPLEYISPHMKPDLAGSMGVSIKTAAGDTKIMERLKNYGYTRETLKQGMALCNQVRRIEQDSRKARIEAKKAKASAHDLYSITFKIAKLAFKEEAATGEKLQLSQPANDALGPWHDRADNFYSTLLSSEDLMLKMERFGFSKEKLKTEHTRVRRVGELLAQKESLSKSRELAELSKWIKQFKEITKIALKDDPEQFSRVFPDTGIFKLE